MPKRFIYTRPDGSVSVVVPAPSFLAKYDSVEEALAVVKSRSVPVDAVGVELVDVATIPANRIFRNAWIRRGRVIDTDMPKARTIHMGRMRVERDAELIRLDPLYVHASAADRARLNAERKVLLDIPQTFDLSVASTPEELDALWPNELPARR